MADALRRDPLDAEARWCLARLARELALRAGRLLREMLGKRGRRV